jgi:hypothetical protein
VMDAAGAPEGEKFLRVHRDPGQGVIRVRNPTPERPFTPDGVVRWFMKNNSLDAMGTINFRVPVNGGTSNLFNAQVQGELNGEFRWGRIRYVENGINYVASANFPRDQWTEWRVEFFTSDPSNPHMHVTLFRVSDGGVIWSKQNMKLAETFKYNDKWGRTPEQVETINGFDIASVGTYSHDFSFDHLRAFVSLPGGYETWRNAHFAGEELQDENISGPAADPGGFGVSNLVRYAFGLEARQPARQDLPRIALHEAGEATYLSLTYTRLKELNDVIFEVEASGDLETWEVLDLDHVTDVTDLGEMEEVTWRDSVAIADGNRRFLRLALSLLP